MASLYSVSKPKLQDSQILTSNQSMMTSDHKSGLSFAVPVALTHA